MAATQKPVASIAFDQTLDRAAWKTIPSWYLVTQEDRAINPELERFMAKRIGAKTSEIQSSHVPFVSRPKEVIKFIETAATAAMKAS
jgi:pimeloyl-ACP methyl ester carboxylesterase